MSFSDQTCETTHEGNGSNATPYPIGFAFTDPAHVKVRVRDTGDDDDPGTVLTPESHYTVAPESGGTIYSGGTITTAAPYDGAHHVTVYRETPATQPAVFQTGGQFPASALETALDRVLMIVAELRRDLGALSGKMDGFTDDLDVLSERVDELEDA